MALALNRPKPPTVDAVTSLLADLLMEVRGLRADLARDRRPSHLTRGDRDRLAAILPAAGGVFGSELFLTRDLFASEAAALRLVLRGLNAKQVGRLFRRGEGYVIDGYGIERDGFELHAVLWRVVQAPEFSNLRNLPVPPRAGG